MVGFKFDLFGHHVIVHFHKLRSRFALLEFFWSLLINGWISVMLLVMMARLSMYVVVLHVVVEELKW